jgi:hypothetical protein
MTCALDCNAMDIFFQIGWPHIYHCLVTEVFPEWHAWTARLARINKKYMWLYELYYGLVFVIVTACLCVYAYIQDLGHIVCLGLPIRLVRKSR